MPKSLVLSAFLFFITILLTPVVHAVVYTYDELNRLKEADYENGQSLQYQYDASGNLIGIILVTSTPDDPTTITQQITLSPGWNLISFCLNPEDMTPEALFQSVSSDLVKVKDIHKSYDPNIPSHLNNLTELENGGGYWVNLNQAITLNVSGPPIDAPSAAIQLKEGWNLVAYLCQEAKPVEEALAGIMSVLVKVKSIHKSYDPNIPSHLNNLTELKPGSGYWIKVSSDTILTYSNN